MSTQSIQKLEAEAHAAQQRHEPAQRAAHDARAKPRRNALNGWQHTTAPSSTASTTRHSAKTFVTPNGHSTRRSPRRRWAPRGSRLRSPSCAAHTCPVKPAQQRHASATSASS